MSKEKIISEIINTSLKLNIFENTRKRNVVDARSLFCYILRKDFNYTLHRIRDIFIEQGRSSTHSTIIHNVNIYDVVLKENESFNDLRNLILSKVSYKHLLLKKIEQIEDEGILKDINNCINHYE
jgi:chromosomal replication initiation ATPase DnaA